MRGVSGERFGASMGGPASRVASAGDGWLGWRDGAGQGRESGSGSSGLAGGARLGSRGAADTRRAKGGPGRARGDAGERESGWRHGHGEHRSCSLETMMTT